jgi:hypothetical protein
MVGVADMSRELLGECFIIRQTLAGRPTGLKVLKVLRV